MIVNLGGLGLVGTIGCATVQCGSCRCVSFVRGPAQLSGAADADAANRNCAQGEVQFSVVRAPFAVRNNNKSAFDDQNNSSGNTTGLATGVLKDERGGGGGPFSSAMMSDPVVAMVQRAVDRAVIHEALPLARFELIVQVLSSTDDESDLQCIAGAACAALVDGGIQLRDIFGAASVVGDDDDEVSNNSNSSSSCSIVQAVVMAHSGGPLGVQSSGSFAPEELCAAVEKCCAQAASNTLSAFSSAAARAVDEKRKKKAEEQKTQTS